MEEAVFAERNLVGERMKSGANLKSLKRYRFLSVACRSESRGQHLGNITLNVEPLPGSLSTSIDPLCFSTRFLMMDNSSPVPRSPSVPDLEVLVN